MLLVGKITGKLPQPEIDLFWKVRVDLPRGQAWAGACVTDGADSRRRPTEELWRRPAVTFKARIVIRVTLDACFRGGNYFIGSFARRDSVTVRAIQLCLRRAMGFMLEARIEERLSRLSVGVRTGLPLWATRLGFYQLGRGQLRGESDNRERTEDCESNQTASDLTVAPFALTQPRYLSPDFAI